MNYEINKNHFSLKFWFIHVPKIPNKCEYS